MTYLFPFIHFPDCSCDHQHTATDRLRISVQAGMLWPWPITAEGAIPENPHLFYLCLIYFLYQRIVVDKGMTKTVEKLIDIIIIFFVAAYLAP